MIDFPFSPGERERQKLKEIKNLFLEKRDKINNHLIRLIKKEKREDPN